MNWKNLMNWKNFMNWKEFDEFKEFDELKRLWSIVKFVVKQKILINQQHGEQSTD